MNIAVEQVVKGVSSDIGGPFGCIFVKDGNIVGRGSNIVLPLQMTQVLMQRL